MRRAGKWVAGVVIIGWSLAPIYWAVVVSLSTPAGLQSMTLIPHPFTFGYFSQLLSGSASAPFLESLRNSAVESVLTTAVTVVVAVLAAYPFARWKFRGSRVLFLVILGTFALPVYAVLIPLYQFMSNLREIDTYQAIVLINVSASLPLAVWLLRAHIAALPADIENAARLDGAGAIGVLYRIVMPLIAPGVAAAAVIVFLTSWAAYLIPLAFAPTLRTSPLTVLIPQFASRYGQNYGLQAAAGLIALLPPVLVVIWLNRHLMRGLLTGALKQLAPGGCAASIRPGLPGRRPGGGPAPRGRRRSR